VPTNPSRYASTPTPSTASTTGGDNKTIKVDSTTPIDDDKDDNMPDIKTPTFEEAGLTDKEKLQAVYK
jgi:hypothetical protein